MGLRDGAGPRGSLPLIRTDGSLRLRSFAAGMTQPAQPFILLGTKLRASDPKRRLDVAGVAATNLTCRREMAAEVGADSRDGRSGEGEPDSGAAPVPLTGNPGRRVGANR